MFNINDIKNGMTFLYEGNIYQVMDFLHVKPGKGAAFVKAKIKNLRTGSTVEKTFNTSIKLERAVIDKKPMQYLYSSSDDYNFMNMETYEQISLTAEQLGENVNYLIEGLNIDLSFYNGELLGVLLPEKITVEIVKTEPAVKGNTTNNAMKEAYIETGFLVKVPLFVEQGEKIIISTSTGKYDSRA